MTFTIEPVGAWKGYDLFHSLTTALGSMAGVLGDTLDNVVKKKARLSVEDLDIKGLLAELPGVLQRLPPDEFQRLAEILLANCFIIETPKGSKQAVSLPLLPMFETRMQGKLLTVFKLVIWAIQVNFEDFFSGAVLAAAAAKEAATSEANPSEQGSTPSSDRPQA